jgi:hypothetical protein
MPATPKLLSIPRRATPPSGAAGLLALSLLLICRPPDARAEFKLHSPIIDYRELEFEHNGDITLDKSGSGKNNGQSFTYEIGYGVTPWWEPEIEGEFETVPGQNQRFSATTFENTFQLTEQGKYWADLGFFAEFSHASWRNEADSFTFGPLVQKEANTLFGLDLGKDTLHTLNLLVSKEIGLNHSEATPLLVAWQSRLRLNPFFEPGIEYYGQISSIAGTSDGTPQQHRLGPVVVGQYNMFQYGKIKYEMGYLFGLNQATERGAVRWRLEYEKAF